MENKITSERIKNHFKYDWFKYLAVLIACIFVFCVAYVWMGALRVYERLECFITCYEFYDQDNFERDVVAHLNGDYVYSDTNSVKEVNTYTLPAHSGSWGETLSAYGHDLGTLIVVLPESQMETWANWFFPLKKSAEDDPNGVYTSRVWDRIIPNELKGWYENEENVYWQKEYDDSQGGNFGASSIYGLRLDNLPGIENYFKFTLTEEEAFMAGLDDYQPEKYYLLVNYMNYNLGEYGYSSKYYSHAEGFEVVKYFLTRYGVQK